MTTLRFRTEAGFKPERLTWGRPDSVPTAICSYCSGALPDVPLIISKRDGSTIQLCDDCCEKWVTTSG